jgi:hypothetical protein
MARARFEPGEAVEMLCDHVRGGRRVVDWLPGQVVSADQRMVAVRLTADVFSNTGWPVPDRTLWCTHGSRKLRRPGEAAPATGAGAGAGAQE